MRILRFVVSLFSMGLIGLCAGVACGQVYPNKAVRIVTSGAGGGGDFTARQIAQGISGPLGQPVIVDNRATGVLAAEFVSRAAPDGYTLLVNGAILWVNPLLTKAPFDAVRDFSPISLIETSPSIMALHPSLPAKSVKDLIALAKARPGELNSSSGATGSPAHLGVELFKSMAGVNIVNVPYKGIVPALSALISGEVQLSINDAGLVAPHVKSGRLRALAVTSAMPSALVPGLPTVSASGLPGYESVGRTGIWAPAKTPGAIIDKLNQEIVRVLNQADVKEKFLSSGVEPVGSSPEEFAATIKSEIARMAKVIKDAGITAN